MKGIIITSHIAGKDKTVKVAIPNGVATVSVNMTNNELFWGAGVMTTSEGKNSSWDGGGLSVGDRIHLKFTNIENPTPPMTKEEMDTIMNKFSSEEDEQEEIEIKLKRYHKLKLFLKDNNII